MVKETKFRHHPVRIENGLYMGSQQLDIVGVKLAFLDRELTSGADSNTTSWTAMDLNALVVARDATVPTNAVAVILDVKVRHKDAAGNYYMQFASVGLQDGKTETVYIGQGIDRWGSRTIIIEVNDAFNIFTKITAGGTHFDYSINLIGWLIGGTRVSRVTFPSVDLYAKFTI